MSNLFDGLEAIGLGKLSNVKVYDSENTLEKQKNKVASLTVTESDLIFDKTYHCPVCGHEFKNKTVKTGKARLVSTDTDLRPKYQLIDSLKYDVIACPHCGYAALNRYFDYLTTAQAKLIRTSISAAYKGKATEGSILTYDEAIQRHKLALLNAIVKKGKLSERAYVCLKLAWLMRGKRETLPTDLNDYKKVCDTLIQSEEEFLKNAYQGFTEALSKELFPICGMDELTITYLLADLARKLKKYKEAKRYISEVIVSREASNRIKEKARRIKEMIAEETGEHNY